MEFVSSPRKEAEEKGSPSIVVNSKTTKLKHRKAECSWCKETTEQVRITKHVRPKRSKYQCKGCFRTTAVCRMKECTRMARAHRGWYEELCHAHTKFYKEETHQGRCSWCFKDTTHTIFMDNLVNKVIGVAKVYNCNECNRATKKCRKCKTKMARIGGTNSTSKCFECYELIKDWDSAEEILKATTLTAWCPWCVNQSSLVLKELYSGKRKDLYTCQLCMMESVTCSRCPYTMVKNRQLPAFTCHLCKYKKKEDYWLELQAKYKEQVKRYEEEEGYVEEELKRQSTYREKAQRAGLIKPFLLLVSMHPEMRAAVGYKLNLQLIKKQFAGDTHAEADCLLFHKKKGIRKRSNALTENVGISQDANWYQILRRAIRDITGYSTFASIPSTETYTESLNPQSELICALEEELLEVIARRHLMMLPTELKEKASELYETEEVQEIFENVKKEGMSSHSMCIVFISIIISQSIADDLNGGLSNVKSIKIGDFLRFLKNYLQGRNATTNRLKTAQESSVHLAFILTKIIVLKTVAQVVAFVLFPPAGVLIEVGFMALAIPTAIVVLMNKSTRDISCPAVVLITLQNFLLATSKLHLT